MGSIKKSRSGRQRHWTDRFREYFPPWRLERNPKKQVKSLSGQLPLFDEVPIGHLEKPKKKKMSSHDHPQRANTGADGLPPR